MVPSRGDDEIARWATERFNAALLDVQSRHALWQGGKARFSEVQAAAERLLRAELALRPGLTEADEVLRLHLALAEDWLRIQSEACDEGTVYECDRELARYWLLDLRLAHAKQRRQEPTRR
jgi:hypothetical protein